MTSHDHDGDSAEGAPEQGTEEAEAAASGDAGPLPRTFAEWQQHLLAHPDELRSLLRSARTGLAWREKRAHLTATALNTVLENAGTTTAKSVVANFLSGALKNLSETQLGVLIRELAALDVLPLRTDALADSPGSLDLGYEACLGRLAKSFASVLGTSDSLNEELRRWSSQYFLVRRSFFAPGRYCRAHLRLQYDDTAKTMLVVETNRHRAAGSLDGLEGSPANAEPQELLEYYDGVLFVQSTSTVAIVSSERIDGGRRRGLMRVTMLDRFVLDPNTGAVCWAKGQMLISGRNSEPVVLYRPHKDLSTDEARSASALLRPSEVDPTVLAQLEAEYVAAGFSRHTA